MTVVKRSFNICQNLCQWRLFIGHLRLRLLETELENDELAQYILDLFKAKDVICSSWMTFQRLPVIGQQIQQRIEIDWVEAVEVDKNLTWGQWHWNVATLFFWLYFFSGHRNDRHAGSGWDERLAPPGIVWRIHRTLQRYANDMLMIADASHISTGFGPQKYLWISLAHHWPRFSSPSFRRLGRLRPRDSDLRWC